MCLGEFLPEKMLEPAAGLVLSPVVMKTIRNLTALIVFCAISMLFITPADAAPRGVTPIPPVGPVVIKPAVSGL